MRIKATKGGPRLYAEAWPSVTEVLKICEGQHLNYWRRKVGDKEADAILHNASVFGTHLHCVAEKIALGTYKWDDPDMKLYAQAIERFLSDEVAEVIKTEAELVSSRLRFGGTLDLYCRLKDGSLAIVDWKSSAQLQRKHGLQLAGYAMLVREHDMPVNKRLCVRIKKEAPGKFYVRAFNDHAQDVKAFLAAVEIWWWQHGASVQKRIAKSA